MFVVTDERDRTDSIIAAFFVGNDIVDRPPGVVWCGAVGIVYK
jgi:hypothetical protein